jgi:hypothetical protein
MKKPICETCIYWEKIAHKTGGVHGPRGVCCKTHGKGYLKKEDAWCGEHQDFEDWIKYNKEKKKSELSLEIERSIL